MEQVEKYFLVNEGGCRDITSLKEGNKKMPIPRQKVIDNPIPTSLLFVYKVLSFVLKLHHQCPKNKRTTTYEICRVG